MESTSDYTIRVATLEDRERIVDFARTYFFVDEPLTIAIRLMEGGGQCTELEDYCTESLTEGNSLLALSSSDELIGMCLNGGKHRKSNPESAPDLEPPVGLPNTKFRNIVRLLDQADEQADVFGRFPDINSYVDIKILSVDPKWRGRGIAKNLMDKTREVAREQGFPMVRCVATSHYTALAVARLGFVHIHTLPYKSFVDSDGKVVFETEHPHDNVETYVAHL